MKYIDDIIEFNSILDNKSSNILSMEDFNDLQILESSGSIFNKNWEKFFEYLYKLVLKQKEENKLTDITKDYTPEEEEKLYIKITKDKFEEFGCKFPGGDKFDYIYVAVLDDPYYHMENTDAGWVTNTDEHPAYLGIFNRYLDKIIEDKDGLTEFEDVCSHEITHGFNNQKKNKYYKTQAEDQRGLNYIFYLYDNSEENAWISQLGVTFRRILKNHEEKRHFIGVDFGYNMPTLKTLIGYCDSYKNIHQYEMKLIDDKKSKGKKEKDNKIIFTGNLPKRNFYSYEDYKERFLPISNNEYKGDINVLDIVSAIFYYVNKYKDFIFYKIPLDAFINAFHKEEDYDKLYDAIVKLTVKENKKYFNRVSKLAHEVLLEYFEDDKVYSEKDLRRDIIRMKRELREGVLICPKCETKNPVVNIFCSKCGHKLDKSDIDSKKAEFKSKYHKNWVKFCKYLYKLVAREWFRQPGVDITKTYTPEEEEKLYLKVTKDKFEEFGCKFPGGDKFDYIYVAKLRDPTGLGDIEVIRWTANTDEHPAYLGIYDSYMRGYETHNFDKFADICSHKITHGVNHNKPDKNWVKFFKYLYELVKKQYRNDKEVDITKDYTPEEEEELYIKITKDKFEEFGCKFPGGDKFDYIYVAVLVDPSDPVEVYVKWIDNTDEHPAYLGISKECVFGIDLYKDRYNNIYDKFAARCLHEINHQDNEFLGNK